jgi:hypothetical protein
VKSDLTQAELRRMFDYREDGQLIFRSDLGWAYTKHFGKVAGHINKNGYRSIRVNKRLYLAHHLVWLWHTGNWPSYYGMDHINRDPGDNRIQNLRDVPFSVNLSNRRQLRPEILSGVHPARGHDKRWAARINLGGGRQRRLGIFLTQEEAHEAFRAAHIERFGSDSQYFKES